MAASFWKSTHARALVTKERLQEAHAKDQERGLSLDHIQQIKSFVACYLEELAKNSQSTVRQRVVGTAVMYMRMWYMRGSMCDMDPRTLGPACLYLAAKAEEAQVQAKLLFHFIKKTNSSGRYHHMPHVDIKTLLDLEMAVLEGLDFNLVIFSPYHELERLLQDGQLKDIASAAWGVCTDSYRTDLCLLYPPYIIALACIVVAAMVEQRNVQEWLDGLDVDYNLVNEVAMELLAAYERYREPITSETCHRLLELLR